MVKWLVLLLPGAAVLAFAFTVNGFLTWSRTASSAMPPGAAVGSALPPGISYSTSESLATRTPFLPSPTKTPTPEPMPTPKPRRTRIGPPVSLDDYEQLFAGVFYKRQTSSSPRPYVAHIVIIDLNKRGIKLVVTPKEGLGQKTSTFLETYGLDLAINGDGWVEDYDPTGFAASMGEVYSDDSPEPTIYISRNGAVKFGGAPPGRIWNAISGSHTLVRNGRLSEKIQTCALKEVFCQDRAARTSIGISAGNYLIIIVVEGPPSTPQEALTLEELARLHLKLGSVNAIAMDGGGSTTLVVDNGGAPHILNTPADGTERVVANHLGISARSLADGND